MVEMHHIQWHIPFRNRSQKSFPSSSLTLGQNISTSSFVFFGPKCPIEWHDCITSCCIWSGTTSKSLFWCTLNSTPRWPVYPSYGLVFKTVRIVIKSSSWFWAALIFFTISLSIWSTTGARLNASNNSSSNSTLWLQFPEKVVIRFICPFPPVR